MPDSSAVRQWHVISGLAVLAVTIVLLGRTDQKGCDEYVGPARASEF